jgi:tetratricopeptide (TPR) repeat protein
MNKKQSVGLAKHLIKCQQFLNAVEILAPHRHTGDEEVLCLLLACYQKIGMTEEALKIIEERESLARPLSLEWYSIKAQIMNFLGRRDDAEKILIEGLSKHQNSEELNYNLSVIYANQGNWKRSLELALQAYKKAPNNNDVLLQLGRIYIGLKDVPHAKNIFSKLIKLAPKEPDPLNGMGAAFLLDFEVDKAIEYFEKALKINDKHPTTLGNLGVAYKTINQYEKARVVFEKAIKEDPINTEHHWNLSLLQLLEGNFKQGWSEYEWRYHPDRTVSDRVVLPTINVPMLKNDVSVQGKTIALMAEQGFGDNIQFARYVKLLREEGAKVVVMTPDPMLSLMQTLPWANYVTNRWASCPAIDYWSYPMSLPIRFKTTLESIPKQIPYLFRQVDRVVEWQGKLGKKTKKLRVGLVWAGKPGHGNDKKRSMKLSDFAALASEQVEFISLQTGERSKDVVPAGMDLKKFGDQIRDFSDSAAILSQLDLLITIDSAPAHLAGAMNCPVWVLLPSNPDFRWLLEREDSPWYSESMILYRQTETEQWGPVVEKIRCALVDYANNLRSRETIALPNIPYDPNGLNEAGALPLLRIAIEQQTNGQADSAASIYQFILRFSPWETDAWRNLAVHYRRIGEKQKARECYEQCLRLDPLDKNGHANFANLLADNREMDLAEFHAKKAIEIDSQMHNAWYILSSVYLSRNECAVASEMLEKAIVLQPDNHVYITMRGLIAMRDNKYLAARIALDNAAAINPAHPEMLIGKAQLLTEEGRFSESYEMHNSLLKKDNFFPDNLRAELYSSRATLHAKAGNFDLIVPDIEESVKLAPGNADARFNLGIYKLMMGDYETGWKDYEWRYAPSRMSPDRVCFPEYLQQEISGEKWEGQSLAGKRITIFPEQGFGDNIQFVRYAKLLKERGATVYFVCHVALNELFQTCQWLDGVFSEISQIPQSDYWVLALSLPAVFQTNIETVPGEVPYFRTPQPYVNKWKSQLEKRGLLAKPLILIVNQGSKTHGNDRNRSIPIEELHPLLDNPNYSFALIDQARQDQSSIDCCGQSIVNLGVGIDNFCDLAALVESSTLLISIDSAPLHLAGALNKAAWGILAYVPDWRWMVNRDDSVWYPSISLFRQPSPGNWADLISQVNDELRRSILVAQDSHGK